MARPHLDLSPSERAKMLVALKTCREVCIDVCSTAPIDGDAHRSASDVNAAIDRLATALTGEPRFFSRPMPGLRFACLRCLDKGWLCDEHETRPHPHEEDGCAGPGHPCPLCNAGDSPRPVKGFVRPVEREE